MGQQLGSWTGNYIHFSTQLYMFQYTQKSPQQLSMRTDVSLHNQEVQGLLKGPAFINTALNVTTMNIHTALANATH